MDERLRRVCLLLVQCPHPLASPVDDIVSVTSLTLLCSVNLHGRNLQGVSSITQPTIERCYRHTLATFTQWWSDTVSYSGVLTEQFFG